MISLLPHSFYLQRKKKFFIVATLKNWQKAKISSYNKTNEMH